MFVVGGESQTEIFSHNTKAIAFFKKLGKCTNWLKNNVVCPEIYVGIKNHYF